MATQEQDHQPGMLTEHNRRVVAWKDAQDFSAFRPDKAAALRNTMLLLGFSANIETGTVVRSLRWLVNRSVKLRPHGVRPVTMQRLCDHLKTLEKLGLAEIQHVGSRSGQPNAYLLRLDVKPQVRVQSESKSESRSESSTTKVTTTTKITKSLSQGEIPVLQQPDEIPVLDPDWLTPMEPAQDHRPAPHQPADDLSWLTLVPDHGPASKPSAASDFPPSPPAPGEDLIPDWSPRLRRFVAMALSEFKDHPVIIPQDVIKRMEPGGGYESINWDLIKTPAKFIGSDRFRESVMAVAHNRVQ
jgi:hypothetical protein